MLIQEQQGVYNRYDLSARSKRSDITSILLYAIDLMDESDCPAFVCHNDAVATLKKEKETVAPIMSLKIPLKRSLSLDFILVNEQTNELLL